MHNILEVKDIVNRFGKQTVHDGVNLALKQGEILGLVGSSGSGKSVLLRTILGLHKPAKGGVFFRQRDIYQMPRGERVELQKSWGVLFQDGALFSGLSVLDNIALPMREHTKLSAAAIEGLSLFKLHLVGLNARAGEKFPSQLSGGMARRAALARSISLDPDILFLDEPTDGLDPAAANAFDEMILTLRDVLNLSVMIVTHDLNTLTRVCDRVAILSDGKVRIGTLQSMLHARDENIQGFFRGPRMAAAVAAQAG